MSTDENAFPIENQLGAGLPSNKTSTGNVGWYTYQPLGHGAVLSATTSASREAGLGVVSPPPALGEVDIWLTEWQVAEDLLQVTVGETVTWEVVPMDHDWITRLFGDRRAVPLQRDTYAGALPAPADGGWTEVRGVVQRIDQVSVPYVPSTDALERGLVPQRGAAVTHTVSAIWPKHSHPGLINGWIIRVLASTNV